MAKRKKTRKEPKSQTQAFYMETKVYNMIIKEAKSKDRSKSYTVNKILKDYYRKKAKAKKRKLNLDQTQPESNNAEKPDKDLT